MNMTEFAEQILCGSCLEDKLQSPEVLIDDGRPFSGAFPRQPGRPQALTFPRASQRGATAFPKMSEFDQDHKRGEVLHFFANHELLALELMALVLLRFPDAPRAFRRGLSQTMRDEQKHMRLYIDHMQRLGVAFGEKPVGDFFWRMLKDVQSPYEFVAQMALTFEQANLDFALYYAKVFEDVGDQKTASVLHEVYEDEVRHVRHGLQWFRAWKPQNQSDWEAFEKALRFPLSPARAKGTVFSEPAREAVGFDKHYVESLRRFNQSKGRPPRIFVYNPAQELEVGVGGLSYTQSALLDDIAHDLEPLMVLIAARDDVVALRSPLSETVKKSLSEARIPVPEVVPFSSTQRQIIWKKDRPFAGLHPWGQSPVMDHLAHQMDSASTRRTSQPNRDKMRRLVSKAFFAEARRREEVLRGLDTFDQCARRKLESSSARAQSFEEVLRQIQHFSSVTQKYVVLKAPFGSSGRNQIRIEPSAMDEQQSYWIKRSLSLYGELVVEPWRQVVAEFSQQATVLEDGAVVQHGLVRNISSVHGQYLASCVGKVHFGLERELRAFLYSSGYAQSLEMVTQRVATLLHAEGYSGPFGVDSYVYKSVIDSSKGEFGVQYLSETNLRHTMGRVALEARRFAQAGRCVFLCMPPRSRIGFQPLPPVELTPSGSQELVSRGAILLGGTETCRRVVPCVWVCREAETEGVLSFISDEF